MRAFNSLIAATLFAACTAVVADDLKVSQLEQDVRELRQQLMQYSRRIERLEAELLRSNANRRPVEVAAPRGREEAVAEPRPWLDIAKWERVRVGMTESEVLQSLGPPTTVRTSKDSARQTLFYALELGAGSFLSGSITLDGKQVVEVAKPALK